jgi:hypothetical protein
LRQAKKAGPLRDVERRARLERKDGFVTGIDLFADEERVRRETEGERQRGREGPRMKRGRREREL